MDLSNPIWYANHDHRFVAGTTTRHGGKSRSPFESFNLGFQTGESRDIVFENRKIFSSLINVDLEQMVFTNQSHSTVLKRVSEKDKGKGKNAFDDGIEADALFTTERNVLLGVFHADCVPVFVYHPKIPLIAIIHAGTVGSLNNITGLAIQQLTQELNINPSEFITHLGPALDFAHHPISEQRALEIIHLNPSHHAIVKKIGGEYWLDIPLLNYIQLIDAGVHTKNICMSNLDTFSQPHDFFSYQRDPKTGRHISFILIP